MQIPYHDLQFFVFLLLVFPSTSCACILNNVFCQNMLMCRRKCRHVHGATAKCFKLSVGFHLHGEEKAAFFFNSTFTYSTLEINICDERYDEEMAITETPHLTSTCDSSREFVHWNCGEQVSLRETNFLRIVIQR